MKSISVENLAKSYRLGTIGTGTFFRDFERWRARMTGKPDPYARIGEADHGNRDGEEIWALRDVSFEVEQGEVLGIIGRNGAGKSTLLKILSRVTAPTSGQIKVRGRIASLLEVGTGFHPELTGRENIYLNGAILGMTRAEVRRKFDEIVDFAGVEKFIDTPVKRYSSGMYVRLAFAVAAHLEPEILVVDEVLAVGDAEFQKKCLGKMGEVAKGGRTVLFVSHNMAAIQSLCTRGVFIYNGMIKNYGEVNNVIAGYLHSSGASNLQDLGGIARKAGHRSIIQKASITSSDLTSSLTSTYGSMRMQVECVVEDDFLQKGSLGFVIKNALGLPIFACHSNQYLSINIKKPGVVVFEAKITPLPLAPGIYYISLYFSDGINDYDVVDDAILFEVYWAKEINLQYPPFSSWGSLFSLVDWRIIDTTLLR